MMTQQTVYPDWKGTLSTKQKHHFQKTSNFLGKIGKAFQHEIKGSERIHWNQSPIFLIHHSFATLDLCLFVNHLYQKHDHFIRALADRSFFQIPALAHFFRLLGIEEGSQTQALKLTKENWALLLSPGGIREATRSCWLDEKRVRWSHAKGYLDLIQKAQRPVHLVVCQNGDQILSVRKLPLSRFFISSFHLPLVFPEKMSLAPLSHVISPAFDPLPPKAGMGEKLSYALHLQKEMQALFES